MVLLKRMKLTFVLSVSRVTSRTWKRAHSVVEMNSMLLFVNM